MKFVFIELELNHFSSKSVAQFITSFCAEVSRAAVVQDRYTFVCGHTNTQHSEALNKRGPTCDPQNAGITEWTTMPQ